MALGGGGFTTQNKGLPGAYINFVSKAAASSALSDRGIAAMPLELDWGMEGDVFEVTNEDFQKDSMKLFGYPCSHPKMKGLCDLFLGARKLYAYRLNGGGEKAGNQFAQARYGGVRGNDLKIAIQANVDNEGKYDVLTYLETEKVDEQTVSEAGELMANDFVTWKPFSLEETAATSLTGGTNKQVTGEDHAAYQGKMEGYTYNVMGIVVDDGPTKKSYVAFNKRMRDKQGRKFQLVLHDLAADYMGVVSVKNKVADSDCPEASLVYWVTGMEAGCEVNKSCQNRKYEGTFSVEADYTQAQLEDLKNAGFFVLHKVDQDVRVLEDINTLVTTTDACGDDFKENQTVRVIDQLGNDVAVLFNTKYLGVVPNNASGRTSLWSDLVKLCSQLQAIGAIEAFSDSDITVEKGEGKKAVTVNAAITVVNTMSQLYMTVTVA